MCFFGAWVGRREGRGGMAGLLLMIPYVYRLSFYSSFLFFQKAVCWDVSFAVVAFSCLSSNGGKIARGCMHIYITIFIYSYIHIFIYI